MTTSAPLRVKPGDPQDVVAAHRLIVDYDLALSGRVEFTIHDFHSLTQLGEFDLDRDLNTVWDGGEMVGVALYWNGDPGSAPGNSVGITHPDHRGKGVGSLLVDLLEKRQRLAVKERPDASGILWLHVDLADEAAHELVQRRGFEEVRRHYTMEIDLGSVAEPPRSEGFEIASLEEAELRSFHEVLEESFSEHWGNTPLGYDEFLESGYNRPDTRLDLWFTARVDEAIAGVTLCRIREGVGWIDALGVLKPYRKAGIGEALLTTALRAFQDEGLTRGSLGVDASNESGAVALYERAGMTAVRVYVSYEKNFG